MNLLSWILIGIACGWLVGALLSDDDPWVLLDLVFATLGAVMAGWWLVPDERAFVLAFDAFEQGAAAAAAAGALMLSLLLRWLGLRIDACIVRRTTQVDSPAEPDGRPRAEVQPE